MTLLEGFVAEFAVESAITRKFLDLVPDDKLDWAPHPKSMKLGRLAGHLAELPTWGVNALTTDTLDIMPVDGPKFQPVSASSRAHALEEFDKNAAALKAALSSTSESALHENWTLLAGGRVMMTMARDVVLRGFVLSHSVHHRAQLGVYFRLLGIHVPATYGPSADEQKMPGQ